MDDSVELFCCLFGGIAMDGLPREQTIYCPACCRKVMHYDGRRTTRLDCACQFCKKMVSFEPKTEKVYTWAIPPRFTSSGTRFYR